MFNWYSLLGVDSYLVGEIWDELLQGLLNQVVLSTKHGDNSEEFRRWVSDVIFTGPDERLQYKTAN